MEKSEAVLTQTIEFLHIELVESRNKEIQLQKSYDQLLERIKES